MSSSITIQTRFTGLKSLAALAFVSLWLPCTATNAQQAPAATNPLPRYVVGPPNSARINKGLCFRELFEKPDQWKETRAMTDALLYADWAFDQFTDAELTAWFAQMKQWGIKLELEVGAIKGWGENTGKGTFTKQKARWDRIQRLGGNIYSIAFDEPLCAMRATPGKTDEYAVEETANFIALVHENYPNIKFGDIEAYPGISLEDNIKWVDALQKKLAERKLPSLSFYRVDVDWMFFQWKGDKAWSVVKELENHCRKVKLPFSLVYWAANEGMARNRKVQDDGTWYVGVMQQGYDYLAVGGAPDQYVIESWENTPSHSVPEAGTEFTFTRSVLDFGRKFVKPAK